MNGPPRLCFFHLLRIALLHGNRNHFLRQWSGQYPWPKRINACMHACKSEKRGWGGEGGGVDVDPTDSGVAYASCMRVSWLSSLLSFMWDRDTLSEATAIYRVSGSQACALQNTENACLGRYLCARRETTADATWMAVERLGASHLLQRLTRKVISSFENAYLHYTRIIVLKRGNSSYARCKTRCGKGRFFSFLQGWHAHLVCL